MLRAPPAPRARARGRLSTLFLPRFVDVVASRRQECVEQHGLHGSSVCMLLVVELCGIHSVVQELFLERFLSDDFLLCVDDKGQGGNIWMIRDGDTVLTPLLDVRPARGASG